MDRFDRIYALHQILRSARQPVSRQRLEDELECSRATVKRIIESMRLYLNAPIAYDAQRNGYHYDIQGKADHGPMYELPGVWFNASELQALLTVQQLLQQVQPGLFEQQMAPLRERIDQLLNLQQGDSESLVQRIRIVHAAARPLGDFFQAIAGATAQRKRLQIDYHARSTDHISQRQVSPQRLVFYRDNWYLDAWCHARKALRIFALDAVQHAKVLTEPALDVSVAELEAHVASAYGIFSGAVKEKAVLRFSPERARWVAREKWHPQQESRWLDDGSFELILPYGNPTELIMDILRFGPDVEVMAPAALREQVIARLRGSLERYA